MMMHDAKIMVNFHGKNCDKKASFPYSYKLDC